ncbi:MAG: hypothetical protein CMC79_00945 [Flavobacteriaceae bacterium]|nr:hypothetical protein [Flavobacteriaceae bacterium]|tara:strand:- start:3544 stop:4320 length:777 start_codon:yes stop_codon:yes gene_type:complete
MLEIIIISVLACIISILTFFSGFGLGTLLTPVLLIFFPAEYAIAITGIVHLVNNIFKWTLVRKSIKWPTVYRFGIPAILAAFIGAYLLFYFKDLNINYQYSLFNLSIEQNFLKLLISLLLLAFAIIELIPQTKNLKFDIKWLPLGGFLSGFFGGLTGVQGALRSAFLIKTNLSKEGFIATAVMISVLVDFTRIGVYFTNINFNTINDNNYLIIFTCLSAILGSLIGNILLKKTTIYFVQKFVNFCLICLAICLALGLI